MLSLSLLVGVWYPIVKYSLIALLVVVSLFIIAIVLIQPGNTQGLGEIGGGSMDTFYAKNKSKSVEGKLKKWTVISGIIFVVGALALTILFNVVV